MREVKGIDKTTIGGRIKAARKALGMTQEELAELMCSTGAVICCYEKNKVDLSASVIKELAVHLQVSAGYLLEGVESELDKDSLELVRCFMAIKNKEVKQAALIQIKALMNL